MRSPLDDACDILDEFEKDVAKVQASWKEIAELNPDFEHVSPENWQEKYYRMWLHGTTEVYECNELERWLYGAPSNTEIASSLAQDAHDAWRAWLSIAGSPIMSKVCDYDKKSGKYLERELKEPSAAYYVNNDRFEIQAPLEGETLLDFILRSARSVEDIGEGHPLEWRALKSFLDFMRKHYRVLAVNMRDA